MTERRWSRVLRCLRFPRQLVQARLLPLLLLLALLGQDAAPAEALTVSSVSVTPPNVGALADYSINFTTGNPAKTVDSSDTITICFPSGTGVPSAPGGGTVQVNGFDATA